MTDSTREIRLLETFARLADTLTADYDVVDLLQTLVDTSQELLDTAAAGILLADPSGQLDLIASTSEAGTLVEMMQLAAEAGPCIESFRTGSVVTVTDIARSPAGWEGFRESALAQGFAAVDAIPMRLRDVTIGTLNLFRAEVGTLPDHDMTAARAFADVATIGIIHEQTVREGALLAEQLQIALNRRVVIEQAKGAVAHTHNVPIDEAYSLIRRYARSHQLPISQVAARVIDRSLRLDVDTDPSGA